jgi:hypothetical protein
MSATRGSSVIEALVGVALGALAVGMLASSILVGVRALTLATGVGAQVTATHDGVERLRHRPFGEIDEVLPITPRLVRRCVRVAGRGRPDALVVTSTWTNHANAHRFAITSEHAP